MSRVANSYDLQRHATFSFGTAMCDTQSYPNAVSTCAPDSDTNIATGLRQLPAPAGHRVGSGAGRRPGE
jgi:hypothetical protein